MEAVKGFQIAKHVEVFWTRNHPILEIKCSYAYEKAEKCQVLVKVVDIFGNDTNKILQIKT